MNPPFIFHPYWSFINSSNVIPLFQMSSFENYQYPTSKIIGEKLVKSNLDVQKKSPQSQKKLTIPEVKGSEKPKAIKKALKQVPKRKQDKNFSYRYQDKDRNIYSNILKGFVAKLRQDGDLQAKSIEYSKIVNYLFSLEDLLSFVDQYFQKSKTYISPSYMKKVLKEHQDSQICKVFSFWLSRYLKEGFTLVLLGSQRIQKQSKILQMKKARELWDLIYGKGEQDERTYKEQNAN